MSSSTCLFWLQWAGGKNYDYNNKRITIRRINESGRRTRLVTYSSSSHKGRIVCDFVAVLCQEDGIYGVNIPKGVWHKLESLEPSSVIFECKEGPFVPQEVEGILIVNR